MYWLIPAALSAVGTVVNTSSARAQNKNRYAVNKYNATAKYSNTMDNLGSMSALAGLNASMLQGQASMQMDFSRQQYEAGQRQAKLIKDTAQLNMSIINDTTGYNNALLDEELALMWEGMDLDLVHLGNQRAVERGEIVANQAASGTVIGQDSNADVVINQKTQEALDTLIVRHNADISAARIGNQKSQNSWQGRMEVIKTGWEGEMGSYIALENARMQAQSTAMQAASTSMQAGMVLAESAIRTSAGKKSALSEYQAGMYGANMDYSNNNTKIRSNFVSGMFGAASAGVSGYAMQKQPTTDWSKLFNSSSSGSAANTLVTSNKLMPSPTTRKFANGYDASFSLSTAGSSLWGS